MAGRIGRIITQPFRAIAITGYLAAAAPARMLPLIAPALLAPAIMGQGCIQRYDDFGSAGEDIKFAGSDTTDTSHLDIGADHTDSILNTEDIAPESISSSDTNPDQIITAKIIDQNLLKIIRSKLGKSPLEDITLADALSLTNLIADSSHIYYVDGLEYFTNLAILALNFNPIEDISPLAGLTNLIYLNLYGDKVSDLSPLANLPLIKKLSLGHNLISDISALLNNPGIGSGDIICLDGNDQIPQWQIEALKAKGAELTCAW